MTNTQRVPYEYSQTIKEPSFQSFSFLLVVIVVVVVVSECESFSSAASDQHRVNTWGWEERGVAQARSTSLLESIYTIPAEMYTLFMRRC